MEIHPQILTVVWRLLEEIGWYYKNVAKEGARQSPHITAHATNT